MATQIESQTQLQDFLGILKRRKWQVILPGAILLSLGVLFAVIVPKKYVARTQVELRPVGISISAKDSGNASFQLRAINRIVKVLTELQNAEYLALPADDKVTYQMRVQGDVRVTVTPTSKEGATFVNIEYVDVDRVFAKNFLQALRDDWIDDVLDRDRNKAKEEKQKLLVEKTRFELELKNEEAQLTELRRQNNLSPTQPVPGSTTVRNEDPLFARLAANEAAKKNLDQELPILEVELKALRKRLEEMPVKLTRENVLQAQSNEGELQTLEVEITALTEQMRGLKPIHTQYKKLSEQLEAKRTRRDQLQRLVTKGSVEMTTVDNPDRANLETAIANLELDIQRKRAMQTGLKAEIDADTLRLEEVHDAYRDEREHLERRGRIAASLADATLKFNTHARLVEQLESPLASPFQITAEVLADSKPTEPNPYLIIAMSLAAGIGLGLAVAVVSEYSRSCFRSVADISRSMAIPVLGAISPIQTRLERRGERLRRTFVGLSGLALIGAIGFVTWAWANDAQLLSQGMRDAIEALRTKLR
jgi:capsular polysaccharide biosynthesis protein